MLLLFARRYLFSRNSRSVINIIAAVSIAAVAVPVAAMIILLSVFNGFDAIIRQLRSSFDADIVVRPARGAFFAIDELQQRNIADVEGVAAFSYVVEQGAMAGFGTERTVAEIRGVDEHYAEVIPVEQSLVSGSYEPQLGEIDRIIMGQGLAYKLGIRSFVVGKASLYALRRNSFSTLLPTDGYSAESFPVGAVFAIDAETDGSAAIIPLRAAQRLFDYPDGATALYIKSAEGDSPRTLEALKQRLQRHLGGEYAVTTRDENNASLYRIMRYEKWGIFFISALVLIIASLSIVGVLVMLIIEKRRDIETLRAAGADTGLLRAIFRAEGVLICSIGGVAGMAAGCALCLLQQYGQIIQIPSAMVVVRAYPVELHLSDALLTAAMFILTAWSLSAATAASMIKRHPQSDKQTS